MGGALSGRRFGRPESVTRPTSDRVREAVASILAARIALEGAEVLELFAGTGAYSFELLSRGAARAVLVERDPRAARDLEASAASLGLTDRVALVRAELGTATALDRVGAGPFDVVIADPPYDLVALAIDVLAALARSGRLAGLVVLEHRTSDASQVDAALGRLVTSSRLDLVSRYRYGDTTISLLAPLATGEPTDVPPPSAIDPDAADPSTDA